MEKNFNYGMEKDKSADESYLTSLMLVLIMLLAGVLGASAQVQPEDSLKDSISSVAPADSSIQKNMQLKEMTVNASPVTQKGDRTKIFFTKEMRRGAVSTIDLLGNLPNFFYNYATGELTYNNSTNIILLVDSVKKDLSYLRTSSTFASTEWRLSTIHRGFTEATTCSSTFTARNTMKVMKVWCWAGRTSS
jgi:hypothetical protein